MSNATPHDTTIGSRVRARREQQGMTQAALAAHIGVTFQQVQKYERGVNRIAAARLSLIARALDVPAAALLGETPDAAAGPVAAMCAHPSGADLARAWLALSPQLQRAVLHLAKAATPMIITGSHEPLRVNFAGNALTTSQEPMQ